MEELTDIIALQGWIVRDLGDAGQRIAETLRNSSRWLTEQYTRIVKVEVLHHGNAEIRSCDIVDEPEQRTSRFTLKPLKIAEGLI